MTGGEGGAPRDGARLRARDGVAMFDGPHPAVHLTVVLGGLALWAAAYWAVLELTGTAGLAAESGPAATAARRHAAAAATGLAGAYYGMAWVNGYGGPLLNFLVPVVAVAFVPDAVLALFLPTAGAVGLSTAGPVAGRYATNPRWVADLLVVWLPGAATLVGSIVLVQRYRWTSAHRDRFRRRWPY